MIFYLTFNDSPSGIYSSQVIDVVKYIHKEFDVKIKLIAFISIKQFFFNRQKIRLELPDAIALPMFPGVKRWRKNIFLLKFLCILFRPEVIIARSVLATQLALRCKRPNLRIVYDGRGAIAAEWKEYKVITDVGMLTEINELEKEAIVNSDFRIAISQQLLQHWGDEYSYNRVEHVVIPCTLNAVFESTEISSERIIEARKKINADQDDLVFAYSGSVAGWQSFDLLYSFILPYLSVSRSVKLLFLSDSNHHISKLAKEFPNQIICKKVSPAEVPDYLIACDYGLILREQSVTNRVASPVKFAEYLACGLKVVLSDNLGDYTNLVAKNDWGYNISTSEMTLEKPSIQEKLIISLKARNLFCKNNYFKEYKNVIIN